jgi:hypothetical protein
MLLQFNTLYDRDIWFDTYPEIPGLVFIEQTKELFVWRDRWICLNKPVTSDTPSSVAVAPNSELKFTSFIAPLQVTDRVFIELPLHSKYVESFGYADVGFEFIPLKVVEQIGNKLFFDQVHSDYSGLPLTIMVSSGGVSPIQFLQDLNSFNESLYATGQLFIYERSMYVYALSADYRFDIQLSSWKGGLIQVSNKGVAELRKDVSALTQLNTSLRVVTFKPLSLAELQAMNGALILRADGTFLLPFIPAKNSADNLKVSIVTRNAESANNAFVQIATGYYAVPVTGKTMRLASTEFPSFFSGCQVIPESYLTYDITCCV